MKHDVTIAILTLNGQEFLDAQLKAIFSQKTDKNFEVIVIDSGSTDNTLNIISKYPKVHLRQIPNSEFGHGKTRNMAMELAKGDFVVFLTQDAVPSHVEWLDCLTEPFYISDKVGCVFGKQIPRAHCFVTTKREVESVFKSFGDDGSISLQRSNHLTDKLGVTNNFFSDVNSAVRRSLHKEIPFKDTNYAEDQALGIDMLASGYIKAFAPLGSVFHSHDYSLRKYYRRKFDEYVGLRKTTGYVARASAKELILGTIKSTLKDYAYIVRDKQYTLAEKLHDFILSPFYNLGLRLAIRRAAKSLTDSQIHKHSLEYSDRKKSSKNPV